MSTDTAQNASQEFLDENQYAIKSILRYERIYGHNWVSTGAESTTKDFCMQLDLKPGQRVLDIGFGTGGSAFFLARMYGARVDGIDLSNNMLSIASDRLRREEKAIQERIVFKLADATKVEYPEASFDVVYSRDVIAHIAERDLLMKRIHGWLKPGGKLLITDICKGDKQLSQDFQDYVANRGYYLQTIKEYGQIFESVGFKKVEATDKSEDFLRVLKRDLKHLQSTKEAFIIDFGEEDHNYMVNLWNEKITWVMANDLKWGYFLAVK